MDLKRGRMTRVEIEFKGQTPGQGHNGTQGWKLRLSQSSQELSQKDNVMAADVGSCFASRVKPFKNVTLRQSYVSLLLDS
jgi:hypothetical protein